MPKQRSLLLDEWGGWRAVSPDACHRNECRQRLHISMCGHVDTAGNLGFHLLFFVCLFCVGSEAMGRFYARVRQDLIFVF